MSNSGVLSIDELKKARSSAITLIARHCLEGQQTLALSNTRVAACGQFVGAALPQRGLHGTAAAIAVLAKGEESDNESTKNICRELQPRLVEYTKERVVVETGASERANAHAINLDQQNVIKQSELLFALSRIPQSVPNVLELRKALADSLKNGIKNCDQISGMRGWSYFLDDNAPPDVLPTAHAVMALSSVNEDVTSALPFLLHSLENKSDEEGPEYSVRIFALYVLAFYCQPGRIDSHALVQHFDQLWQRTTSLLGSESIEQNIEYWRGSDTLYVRVPWQLYILALAALMRVSAYASKNAQLRLRQIVDDLKRNRFRYPHSGKLISSRTTAIAFEMCGHIIAEQRRLAGASFLLFIDNLRSSRRIRWVALWTARVGALLFIALCIYEWYKSDGKLSDFAAEFVGAIALGALYWGKGEQR